MYINLHSVYVVEFSYFSALSVFLCVSHPLHLSACFCFLFSHFRIYVIYVIYRTENKIINLYFILFFSYSNSFFTVEFLLFSQRGCCIFLCRMVLSVFFYGCSTFRTLTDYWTIQFRLPLVLVLYGRDCRQCCGLFI